MASDKLISSQVEEFQVPFDNKKRIRVYVKTYASGRTRVVVCAPDPMNVASVVNGGNTDDLKIELVPA